MTWQPASFLVAFRDGPKRVAGYTYKGLGLSPRQRKRHWALTHLNSGHRIAIMEGKVYAVFPAAFELAEQCDWTFYGLEGWKNEQPDLKDKVVAWAAKDHRVAELTRGPSADNHSVADEIVRKRIEEAE